MGLFDSIWRLTRPYSEDEDDGIDEILTQPHGRSASTTASSVSQPLSDVKNNKVVNIHTTTQLQVVLVKPDRFESAVEVADHLREKRTVVLNLESANKEISRRLIDFLSGVAYALEGKVKKVANSTYIITPYNVDILGDLLDELESSGMYF